MSETVKAYLRAAASVIDILPSTNYMEYISKDSYSESIRKDVYNVAMDMRKVVENEYQASKRETAKP